LLETIAKPRVRDHYRREIKSRLFALWRESGKRGAAPVKPASPQAGKGAARPLPSAHGFAITIILALAHHPFLLDRFAEQVGHIEIKQKQLAGLLAALTNAIFLHPGIASDRLAELMRESAHAKLFESLDRASAFKRIAFLKPETPPEDVEEHFAELMVRWTTLKVLNKEVQEQALDLADLTDESYEQFALLQQQVANAGLRHAADDAGDRDSAKRFQETIARLEAENIGSQRGRRPDRRAGQR
jgi:hypothetical protein